MVPTGPSGFSNVQKRALRLSSMNPNLVLNGLEWTRDGASCLHFNAVGPAPLTPEANRARVEAVLKHLFFLKNSGGMTKIGLPPAPPLLNAVGAAALRAVAQRDSGCGPWVFGSLKVRKRWARALLARSLNLTPRARVGLCSTPKARRKLTLCWASSYEA